MERKYNYFYKIENILDSKFYFGVHKTDDLEDGYVCSGTRINRAIKKYGIENFKKEILLFFDTYKEVLDYELEMVNEELLADPSCYNLVKGGTSGWDKFDKTEENLKTLRKGPALIEKISNKVIKPNDIEEYYRLFNTGNYYGYTMGKVFLRDSSGNHYFLEKNDSKIKELNLKYTTKDKICCKDKNNKFYVVEKNDERILNGNLKKCGVWDDRKHTEETKRKIKETKAINHSQQGNKNSQFGTTFIHNIELKINKRIKKENLEEWINIGWIKGAKFKW